MTNDAPSSAVIVVDSNARTTRARRKSANDSVRNIGPKIIVPTPQSARKAERPSNTLLQQPQRQRSERNLRSGTTVSTKDSVNAEEEEVSDIILLVVSRDDDDDINNTNSPNSSNLYTGSNDVMTTNSDDRCNDVESTSTTFSLTTTAATPTKKFPSTPTMTSIDENGGDSEETVPLFTNLPTIEELHSKMHQLFVATSTSSHNPGTEMIDWNDLIFHRVRGSVIHFRISLVYIISVTLTLLCPPPVFFALSTNYNVSLAFPLVFFLALSCGWNRIIATPMTTSSQ